MVIRTEGSDRDATAGVPAETDLPSPGVSGRQPALDGLRVLAALAVLVVHVGGATGFAFSGSPASLLVSHGDIGVPVFFTLSGLLLYRPWASAVLGAGHSPPTIDYLWRRAVRILPAYWVVVVIAILTLNQARTHSVTSWTQYLLLVQVYNPHPWWDGTGAPGLGQMWSLAVEVAFYAILPLLAILLAWFAGRAGPDAGRRARRLLTGIAILAVLPFGVTVAEFYPTFKPWVGETLLTLMPWFAPGMALAVLSAWAKAEPGADGPVRRLTKTIALSPGVCWLIAGLVFIIACTPVAGTGILSVSSLWQTETKTALYAIVAAAFVAPAAFQPAGPTTVSMLLGNRVMRFLGKISYGVFLWQYLVLYGIFAVWHIHDVLSGGHFTAFQTWLDMAAITVGTVVAATLSYYLIENPAQKLYLRFVSQARAGRKAGSGTNKTELT
jgi:peptidoglycan/LPS O-acetylase OafA/YrhL